MQHQVVEQQHAARAQRHVHHVQRRLAAQIREVRAEVEALVRLVCRVLPALAVAAPRDLSRVEGERVSQRQRMGRQRRGSSSSCCRGGRTFRQPLATLASSIATHAESLCVPSQ